MLARAGAPVTFHGRPGVTSEHLAAVARGGLRLRTVTFDERVRAATSDRPHSLSGAGLVLFCVKTPDTDRAAAEIARHVRADAIVVDLQNGVDNPERLRRAGIDPIPAVVYVAAAVESAGEVRHRGRGDLVIGHPARPADVDRVAGWFVRAGVGCKISADIERDLWFKLIVNSMANATSALTGATYGRLAAFEPTWDVAREVAREAVAVARALGHDLDLDATIAGGLEICKNVGAATSSTEQDLTAGRPTEIDALNGYVARRGSELGIATPVNTALWALVKLRESTHRL
jgi:2-dehydropantoate 2-reductase